MKKFYLLIMAFVCLTVTSMAQSVCPTAAPSRAVKARFPGGGGCFIVLTNAWPNSSMVFLNASLDTIPSNGATTDGSGSTVFSFDCNTQISYIITTNGSGSFCKADVNDVSQGSLPIKLTSFSGRLQSGNTVVLDWTSSIELESSKYEVERSVDGKNYTKVGVLKAAGNSLTTLKYNYIDNLPTAGAYFYRLKQIDIDGFVEYSKVIYVNGKVGAGLVTKVFPNPFNSEVQLIGATSSDLAPGNVKVFTLSGQLVKHRLVGANAIAIDDTAPKGVYILQVKEQRFKLIKN
jgi:hypothetical protein